ncbi:hypothetical protein Bpfe_003497 [Biomphalaria pfeifferi]|uniref:Uncharacterized protein n=1 Tax=Biomphalaria pfeifferi TaxID=112525 RepID=A0AAD8C5B9_BIOPF|nr:hypothetical protein Bpfe_003497 [Biomphalaria pfeifferi]
MIVNVQKDHVVEITRDTPLLTEWTKSEWKANGKCRQKTCRNHITFVNDACLLVLLSHLCCTSAIAYLIYKRINKLSKYLLRCTFSRSLSVLNATNSKDLRPICFPSGHTSPYLIRQCF